LGRIILSDMSSNYFFYGSIAAVTSVAYYFLNKAASRPVSSTPHGVYTIRMAKFYGIIGYICIALAIIPLIIAPFTTDNDIGTYISMLVIFILFGFLGVLSVFYYRNHRVTFNHQYVLIRDVFNREKRAEWSEFEKAKFNPSSGSITFKAKDGRKCRIHQHLIGFSTFVRVMEAQTQWTATMLRLPISKK